MNYHLHASHLQLDGFRDNSATENTLVTGKFRFYPDDYSDWTFLVSQFNSPLAEDPGALTREEADGEYSERMLERVRVAHELVSELDVNLPGVAIIVRMREQMFTLRSDLERSLRELRERLEEE